MIQFFSIFLVIGATGVLESSGVNALETMIRARIPPIHNGELLASNAHGQCSNIIEGWLTIGHEVRIFTPCHEEKALWLLGKSPALQKIVSAYKRSLPDGNPYQPVFVVLKGKVVQPPDDGFGADYKSAFWATHLFQMDLISSCGQRPGATDLKP